MTFFASRRHPILFYCITIFAAVFLVSMGTAIATAWYYHQKADLTDARNALMPAFSVVCCFFGLAMPIRMYRNAPTVAMATDGIHIGRKAIRWAEIENVKLTGKQQFRTVFSEPMEAVTITLTNGHEHVIFDDMYANTAEMKRLLSLHVLGKPPQTNSATTLETAIDETYAQTFKGHPVFSYPGLLMWAPPVVFLYTIAANDNPALQNALILLPFCLLWIALAPYRMNYFVITPTHLIVKNH